MPFPSTATALAPPDEGNLAALRAWHGASICVAAAWLALPLTLVPGVLAARYASGPLHAPILAGVFGTIVALLGFAAFARAIRVPPRGLFLRRPDRAAPIWASVTFLLAAFLVASTLPSAGTPVVGPWGLEDVLVRVAAAAAIGLWTGIVEEFLLRGVVLAVIGHRWHWRGAILVTALLFGALHHAAGTTPVARGLYVLLTVVAGLLLGTIVVASGTVWNAVAVHATWNAAFAGYLVGVDPGATPAPLVVIPMTDPGWLHGAGRTTLSESPLAVLLFVLVGSVYAWRLHRTSRPT